MIVYTVYMKNITFSADKRLIDAARRRARKTNRTLNDEFRAWLAEYAGGEERAARARAFLDHVSEYASTGGHHFTRDEMNER